MSQNKPLILVTGATGQLGTTLAQKAQKAAHIQWVFCSKEDMDLCDTKQVAAIFEQYRPDYCINTAAFTNVRRAEEQPQKAKSVNVDGVQRLIEQCNRHNTCLLHLSTDYVFDGLQSHPYIESDSVNPINVYGKTKAAGEQLLLAQANQYYIIRTAWLYAKAHGQNFYRSILGKAMAGETLTVVNDQVGSPTSTDELADFLLRLIEKSPPHGIYHCAGKEVMSWYTFAKAILKAHQLNVKLIKATTPQEGLKRPRFSALGTTKII